MTKPMQDLVQLYYNLSCENSAKKFIDVYVETIMINWLATRSGELISLRFLFL